MLGISVSSSWLNIMAGCCLVVLGLTYIVRVPAIVREYKLIVISHRRILSMALAGQGLTLCFIGAIVLLCALSPSGGTIGRAVSLTCAGMLIVLCIWTGSTGGRSEHVLFRIAPIVEVAAAMLLLAGNQPQ